VALDDMKLVKYHQEESSLGGFVGWNVWNMFAALVLYRQMAELLMLLTSFFFVLRSAYR
jgi:hypothetical protein